MLKLIVTKKYKTQNENRVQLMPIDFDRGCTPPIKGIYTVGPDINVGDIINETFKKIEYHNCKHVLVIGADLCPTTGKHITIFSPDLGEKIITLHEADHFFYTQRGDELMVQKNSPWPEYKIVTNLTVDKMRSQFLTKQR